ncbi:PE-PGRS family protein [Streptomyces sp. MB09-01]|uniref:PE-PGRS family protein n=1 Tax=Streptomyces sp. MB09-01 TaxID=3028666 RepID=UPI0029A97B4B|nr:PE-PGRS family protein [Streptomyces sp. MB09-01]MDX3540415.1 PE-PGRS family protein [Streptomyces sp. MB09-01]
MDSARGTEEEWAGLEYGTVVAERIREALAWNRAAPERILVRLLDTTPGHLLWRRDLPEAVLDAAVDHPEWSVRAQLAETRVQRGMSAGRWSRLLLAEAAGRRRYALLTVAVAAGARLTDEAYEALATDPSGAVREALLELPAVPAAATVALTADPVPAVRAAACRAAWPHLDALARARLAADPVERVRVAAVAARHDEEPITEADFEAVSTAHDIAALRLDRELAARLGADADPEVRRRLAGNPHLDADLVALLAADPQADVRLAVSLRPELTEEQRAAVEVDIDPRRMRRAIPWVVALHGDEEAMRRLAASGHLLLRSSVATARRLPPDVVQRLARDADRVVRLFLAERCDDAPADMLLEVWQWWNGSLSTPDRPYGHPNFPRRDLLRYAEDPHPRLRQLALDDPDSTPGLVERFSRDEDAEVRRRAATDPRLSADSAVRMLDDPDRGVRATAARHPRLPVPVLIGLLGEEETAGAAALNPALPVAVMERVTATGS